MLNKGVAKMVFDAQTTASQFTNALSLELGFQEDIQARLLANLPTTIVENKTQDFFIQALVLMGLSMKVDEGVPTGLLQASLDSFRGACLEQVQLCREALNTIAILNTIDPGQGERIKSDDTRLESVVGLLANVKSNSDRMQASGSVNVNNNLIDAMKADLDGAIRALVRPGASEDTRLRELLSQLEAIMTSVSEEEGSLSSFRTNAIKFKTNLENSLSLVNVDTAQVRAIGSGADSIQNQIRAASQADADVTNRVRGWATELASLSGMASNTSAESSRTVFETSAATRLLYESLVSGLGGIIPASFDIPLRSISALSAAMLGTENSESTRAQKATNLGVLRRACRDAQTRANGFIEVIDRHPFPTSLLTQNLLDMFTRDKLTKASKALEIGDIAQFFALAEGSLTPVEDIAAELRQVSVEGDEPNLGERLSDAFVFIQEHERADTDSSRNLENAREEALRILQEDLETLNTIEGLLDQAESVSS
jgi:hypothetical protein